MNELRGKITEVLKEPHIDLCDWELGKVMLMNWKAGLPDQVLAIIEEEVEKLEVIKGEEIGDNLDLDSEATYPCSDGSSVLTFSVGKVLLAQLQHDKDNLLK